MSANRKLFESSFILWSVKTAKCFPKLVFVQINIFKYRNQCNKKFTIYIFMYIFFPGFFYPYSEFFQYFFGIFSVFFPEFFFRNFFGFLRNFFSVVFSELFWSSFSVIFSEFVFFVKLSKKMKIFVAIYIVVLLKKETWFSSLHIYFLNAFILHQTRLF